MCCGRKGRELNTETLKIGEQASSNKQGDSWMKRKQYDEWIEKIGELGTSCTGNLATVKEFEELLQVFYPNLVDEWNTLNHWEKLRLIEHIVKGSAKTMVSQ
jgi:hypothetical protein